MKKILVPILFAVFVALAADGNPAISGNWKGTAEGPNGTLERTFALKVDGTKVTGETVSSLIGPSTIIEGKADGDTVTFSIVAKFQDNEMKFTYKGKLTSKDELKLTSEGSAGPSIEWVAKRVK